MLLSVIRLIMVMLPATSVVAEPCVCDHVTMSEASVDVGVDDAMVPVSTG